MKEIVTREKVRLIIMIGLIVMLVISLFTGIRTAGLVSIIKEERNKLRSENEALSKEFDRAVQERKQLEEKVNALSNDLGKASREKSDAQKQYELALKERDGLLEKIGILQKANDQLRGDLSNLQRERQRLGQSMEKNLAPLREENMQLKQQLDNLNSLKVKMEAELNQLKGEKSGLEHKLEMIDEVLQRKLTRYRYFSVKDELDAVTGGAATQTQEQAATVQSSNKESVELPPIVVRPQNQPYPEIPKAREVSSARPAGSVLEVNRENGFVIIDLGADAGVKMGDTFKAYKQGSAVANLEVIQVRQGISACDIKTELVPVQAGDLVK